MQEKFKMNELNVRLQKWGKQQMILKNVEEKRPHKWEPWLTTQKSEVQETRETTTELVLGKNCQGGQSFIQTDQEKLRAQIKIFMIEKGDNHRHREIKKMVR